MNKKQETKGNIKENDKKTRLSNLKQTDGKVEKAEETGILSKETEPRNLAQFFGEKIQGKYRTTDENEYILYLRGLNKSDLQAHAIKCGLVPKDDRNRLVTNLVREFRKVVASYKPLPVIKNKSVDDETMRILARGR